MAGMKLQSGPLRKRAGAFFVRRNKPGREKIGWRADDRKEQNFLYFYQQDDIVHSILKIRKRRKSS